MKKTFRTLLAGALALCAVACYDDSALRTDIAGVKGELNDLKTKFETFQNKLNGEVAALSQSYTALNAAFEEFENLSAEQVTTLNASLDAIRGLITNGDNGLQTQITDLLNAMNAYKTEANGRLTTAEAALEVLKAKDGELDGAAANLKNQLDQLSATLGTKADAATLAALAQTVESITVRTAEEKDGNIVITLANGNTLTVPVSGNEADQTGVVKVVDGEWVVVGEDGTETSLELPVSTPNLQFQIDWRNGDLYYTTVEYPEEEDWIYTGVAVGGNNYGMESVITKINTWESDDYVIITVDGEEYVLPLMTGAGSSNAASLEIKAGKTIVPVGTTKVVEIKAAGLSDVYVMSKPDGWKVSVNGNKLTVTAPVEGNPYAEQDGLVLLHGTTDAGQCIVAKLAVTTSTAGLEIIIDDNTGAVTIKNGILVEGDSMNPGIGGMEPLSLDDELGETEGASYSFAPFWFGFATMDILEEAGSIENLIQQEQIWRSAQFVGMGVFQPGVYSEDYTVDVLKISAQDLYQMMYQQEMPEGTQMVFYATPADLDSPMQGPVVEGLVYDYYNPLIVSITEVEATCTDVALNVTMAGADYYYIGAGEYKSNTEDRLWDNFDSWKRGYQELGSKEYSTANEEILLSRFALDGEWSPLKPSTTYYAFAFPVNEGADLSELDFDADFMPYVKIFTTADAVEGGASEVEITQDMAATDYYSIVADLQVAGDAEMVYYKFYEVDPLENADDPALLVADMASTGYSAFADEEVVARCTQLGPEVARYLAAVAIDASGKFGTIACEELKTKAFPYDNSNISSMSSN
jgi:hypothetical protein